MQTQFLIAILLVAAGGANLLQIVRMYRDRAALTDYVSRRHKAWLWRKLLGADRAERLMLTVFMPVGAVLSLVLVGWGLYVLIR